MIDMGGGESTLVEDFFERRTANLAELDISLSAREGKKTI
jgi:hypothetical protein